MISDYRLLCLKPTVMNQLSKLQLNKTQAFTVLTVLIGLMNIHAHNNSWMPFILVCSVFGTLIIAGMLRIVFRKKEQ